jgi:hypothetical protein
VTTVSMVHVTNLTSPGVTTLAAGGAGGAGAGAGAGARAEENPAAAKAKSRKVGVGSVRPRDLTNSQEREEQTKQRRTS